MLSANEHAKIFVCILLQRLPFNTCSFPVKIHHEFDPFGHRNIKAFDVFSLIKRLIVKKDVSFGLHQ